MRKSVEICTLQRIETRRFIRNCSWPISNSKESPLKVGCYFEHLCRFLSEKNFQKKRQTGWPPGKSLEKILIFKRSSSAWKMLKKGDNTWVCLPKETIWFLFCCFKLVITNGWFAIINNSNQYNIDCVDLG